VADTPLARERERERENLWRPHSMPHGPSTLLGGDAISEPVASEHEEGRVMSKGSNMYPPIPLLSLESMHGHIPPTAKGQQSSAVPDQADLADYPFLKAALEDLQELHLCARRDQANRRHVVSLMFDALEFVLYEILLLHELDIYKTGQNTIGFDEGLSIIQGLAVEIPLIGTVRAIQKHRGDAKHHAQTPDEAAYRRLIGNFEIIISRLVYEQFEESLGSAIMKLPLLNHRIALFESYRRRRNHNWRQAYRFVLGALLRKHREMFGTRTNLAFDFSAGHAYQLNALEVEVAGTNYDVAPRAAGDTLKSLVRQVREMLDRDDWKGATLLVSGAYSTTDKLLPGIFDIDRAKRLTMRLYQPNGFNYSGPMGWTKVWGQKGSEEAALVDAIRDFLKTNGDVVKTFGEPYYETDDDRYWKWWEFAVFDGERWHTFHLDFMFHVSLETAAVSGNERASSAELLKIIREEFERLGTSKKSS
jgi:hypothetical protein